MKKTLKRAAIMSVSLGLVLAMALPMIKAYATTYGDTGDYILKVGMDELRGATLNSLKVNNNTWASDDDDFRTEDGKYVIDIDYQLAAEDTGRNSNLMTSEYWSPYLKQTSNNSDVAVGHFAMTYSLDYDEVINDLGNNFNRISLQIDIDHGGPEPSPEGDSIAILRISGEDYNEGSYSVNHSMPVQPRSEDAVPGMDYSEVEVRYNDDPESSTIKIGFETFWHERYVGTIIINDIPYEIPIDYDDQFSYLEHYGRQILSFTIDVPKANDNIYNIAVEIERSEHVWIGNFLWTADPEQKWQKDCDDAGGELVCEYKLDENGNKIPKDDYIGNSRLALIAAEYTVKNELGGYTTYSCSSETGTCSKWLSDENGEILDGEEASVCSVDEEDCVKYIEFDSNDENGYDDGALVIPTGARVTMQIIPDYGYQVMNVNMDEWNTAKDLGYFTFTIPEGAAYFMAEVVETEDTVITDAEAIADGTIDLGDNQTTIDHGTAKLEVNDVDLNDEDIAGFENASGDYRVGTYLDISLYNITCKGGATCVGTDADSWSEQIDELNEEATITLQLEEGVDGNDVVIVHQKHDGTYEVIPATYDPVTHTIKFKTSSFSNYAIASRTVASPETGEMTGQSASAISTTKILQFVAIVAVVNIIAVVTTRKIKINK